ncbi:1-acyl-sn-glycerol-3-phosphate acyltransferase [Phenylobacterium sp.]|uniref:1-acyl-sn-glycerol-3-phosphate acyltransferase n=1 Tax=Phenylobacterium sp. TaxID=1871053 RepID=UPI002733E2FF|nr:1-acyl-sn-glycerol-3-phosphate acyltransferase [Phenylobacterium sp.]MDP3852717.1 1-acyl-sn-glycerol-3-phosphate acyltransferase [Phenylobacterium sp.]
MTVAASAAALQGAQTPRAHVVDVLIAERAPRLAASALWPLARPLLYALLDYAKARRMADAIAPLPGRAALDHVSDLLQVAVSVRGLDHVPKAGRAILICNHPTGIADGIAVYDALKGVRPDICFYANSDAHRVVPAFDDVLIPVEWVEAKRTRERTRITLQMTREAMEAERAVVIFPAGRLARRGPDGGLSDPEWMTSALSLARKYEAQVVPMNLAGPSSTLFHLFNRFNGELRDITLFHELLNKRGRAFDLVVGAAVGPQAIDPDATAATLALKAYIEHVLRPNPDRAFA